MGQNTLFDVGLLGLLILVAVNLSDGTCPELRPTKKLLCYLNLKGTPPPLDTCLCTHLVVTTPLNKLTSDSDVVSNIKTMRERNPNLQVLGMATDPAENVIKRRGAYVRGLMSVLQKCDLDGFELDFQWTNKFNGKDTFVDLVKILSKEMNKLNESTKRNKRNSEDENGEEEHEESGEETETESSEDRTTTDTTTPGTTIFTTEEGTETTKDGTSEEKDNKGQEEIIIDETLEKHPIVVRLPTQPQLLAKNFDLKRLSKYVNFFTISSENVTDASENGLTYHPSRLMGIEDILNSDSLVDLITGLGAPHPKLILSLPGYALRFTLSNPEKNLPLSPIKNIPQKISQAELCTLMSEGKWTMERDEDLTAPYAFKNDTWLAFDDPISTAIKGKYILLRDLGGAAIVSLDYEDWLGKCNKTGLTLLPTLYDTFTNIARKSRAAQLISLQEQLHQSSPYAFSADIQISPYRIVRVVDRSGATHVVRKEAKTEFECSRQGYFRHPSGCNRFYRCVKFNQYSSDYTVFEYDCPAGLAFDEKYEVCVWPGSLEDGGACHGSSEIAPVPRERYSCPRVEGYYADPENCRWFFACLDHVRDGASPLTAYEFRCPFGLVFNEQTLVCDWPWNVAGCGAAGGYRAHLTVGDILEGRTRASYATLPDYHVSGGRIENAGNGVVLGSLLPGIVDGSIHQGAYSSDVGSKYYGGGGLYQGAGLQSGSDYGQSGGAYAGHGLQSGGQIGGINGYYGAGSKYAGGSGLYSGIYGGQYGGISSSGNGIYSGTGSGSFGAYSSGEKQYSGGIYSGGGGKYEGAGAYSGSNLASSGIYSGNAGKYEGAGAYSGNNFGSSGIYSGNAGKYEGSGIYSGSNLASSGIYSGNAGKYEGAGAYSGSNLASSGIYSGNAGKYEGAGAYSGSNLGSSGIYAGQGGAYSGSGYDIKGTGQYLQGIYGNQEGGKILGSNIKTSAEGFNAYSGLEFEKGYDNSHLAGGTGSGVYYANHKYADGGLQSHSGSDGAYIHGGSISQGSYESSLGNKGYFGAVTPTPGPVHGAGVSYEYDLHGALEGEYGSRGKPQVFVSSTPAPPVTQFHVSTPTPIVSTVRTPVVVTPAPIPAVSTYKIPLSTPRPFNYYLQPDSHISVPSPTPITIKKPVVYESVSYKPVQQFGPVIPAVSLHEAPVSVTPSPIPVVHQSIPAVPISPSPSPLPTVIHDNRYSSFGHEYQKASVTPVRVTPLPPVSPVSYLSGVSYQKPVVPVSTISPPVAVPVSTPAPPEFKLSYHPRPYPVPVESYHVSKPVVPVTPIHVSTPAPIYTENFRTYSFKPVVPVSTIAPPVIPVSTPAPPVIPVSTPAPPVNYYPRPQPVVPVHGEVIETYQFSKPAVSLTYEKEISDYYHHPKPVVPLGSTIAPPVPIAVTTPAPPPVPVKFGYSYPTPVSSVSYHNEGEFGGYQYSKPAVGFSYPKPSGDIFKSIVTTPVPTVTPAPIVVSTPVYSSAKFDYEKRPIEFKSSTISVTQSPLQYSTTLLPVNHKNTEVGYTYPLLKAPAAPVHVKPLTYDYSYPQYFDHNINIEKNYKEVLHHFPVVTPSPSPPPVQPVVHSVEVPHVYPKPAVPVVPLPQYQQTFEVKTPRPVLQKLPVVTPPSEVVHRYEEYSGYSYQKPLTPVEYKPVQPVNYGYSYPKPAVFKTPIIASTPAPKDYYNIPAPVQPVSAVQFGYAYEKPVVPLQPVQYSTTVKPLPPSPPVVHYEQPSVTPLPALSFKAPTVSYGSAGFSKVSYEKPEIYLSTPKPFTVTEPVQYSTVSPVPTVKPIDYGYSYPKPIPSVIPAIQVSSTPVPPLNPVTYTYRKPEINYHTATAGYQEYGTPTSPPVIPSYKQPFSTVIPPQPPKVNYVEPVVPYAPPPKINYVQPVAPYLPPAPSPPTKIDYIQEPVAYVPPPRKYPSSYVKPLPSYSTPAPFKPASFAQLGPKYQYVDTYESVGFGTSTPLPPPVVRPAQEINSFKFGYAYEKPSINVYSTPAPIEISSVTPPPYSSTQQPIVVPPIQTGYAYSKPYIRTETVIPTFSSTLPPPSIVSPTPEVPMYQKVFNAFKTPVVTAYEKVLNVLKTSTPAAPPVYVNHYTTPAPEVIPVTTVRPVTVAPHKFEYTSGYANEQHGQSLYETLNKEYGSKLTSYEDGYNYQKPVVPFIQEELSLHDIKVPSTTYRPVVKKVYTTSQRPDYYESYDYNSGKSDEVIYSSTPAPPTLVSQTYKPVVKQYIQEVYSQPAFGVGYGETYSNHNYDNVKFVTSTTPLPLPPVTTARVSLPIVKTGCINCGASKSQKVTLNPPLYSLPVTYSTTSSPFTTVSSTPTSYLPPKFSTTTLGYSEEEAEEHELEIANQEEEEGAKILEEYNKSGKFGGVLGSSDGLNGVAFGGASFSSTTVSSLKDGEAIVGVVKKEKNIYTGRKDKAKVVVVSRLSDFNPILVGKLGAECSCKSNPVNLKNYGDLSNHRINTDGNLFIPSGQQPSLYTSTSLSPIIVPDSADFNGNIFSTAYGEKNTDSSSIVEIKPINYRIRTTIAPKTKLTPFYETVYSTTESTPVYSLTPSTSTAIYDEPIPINPTVNTLVRHKPVYVEKSLRPTYQQVLVPTTPAHTLIDGDSQPKAISGKSFDRYGPGGLRGFDETLQGSVDCKRPGLFRHPKYCNKFYSCNWDQWKKRYTLAVFNCPVHLAYDQQIGACNWPSKGPACADDNLLV